MNEPLFSQAEQHGPLTQVHEGMEVYDSADQQVGTVKTVYLGNSSPAARAHGQAPATTGSADDRDDSLVEIVAEVFSSQEKLPEALRGRLLREGYIAIEGRFLASDRFATPDQIAAVQEDRVTLNVADDALIKR